MAKDAPREVQPARCPKCRGEVRVPNTFADGDAIGCGVCGLGLRVSRAREGALRLTIADVGPVRDELRALQSRCATLEKGLARARASLGIGVNGLGLGVLYLVAKVGLEELQITRPLIVEAVGIALVSGVALELANFLFLAKRRDMSRLSAEIAEVRGQIRQTQARIREGTRR